jgi:hypothetical protein
LDRANATFQSSVVVLNGRGAAHGQRFIGWKLFPMDDDSSRTIVTDSGGVPVLAGEGLIVAFDACLVA